MTSLLDRLQGLWGLYWLGYVTGWKAPFLSGSHTEKHRCAINTPSGRAVWVSCTEEIEVDYGAPYRFAHWIALTRVERHEENELERPLSLSPLPYTDISLEHKGETIAVAMKGALGLGYPIDSRELVVNTSRHSHLDEDVCGLRVGLEGRTLTIGDGRASLSAEITPSPSIGRFGDLLIISGDMGETVAIDCQEGYAKLEGFEEIVLRLRHLSARCGWLQPFAYVQDYLEDNESLASPYVELFFRDRKYVFLSKSPIYVDYSRANRRALIRPRGPLLLFPGVLAHDMSKIGEWASISINRPAYLIIPKIRVSPYSLVPFRTFIRQTEEGEWLVESDLSNPTEGGVGLSILVDRPFYLKSAMAEGEEIEGKWRNLLELYVAPYSLLRVELRIGCKERLWGR